MSAEPDYLPADALAEDEPKYLRRQKPVEIRKRKFSRKAWPLYRRVLVGGIAALSLGFALYEAGSYLLYSPGVLLQSADQIEILGNRFSDAFGRVEISAGDHDLRPLPGEGLDDGAPDPGAASGDDRDFSREFRPMRPGAAHRTTGSDRA